jgi:heterotetrameric sarcosine oxidase gamma subunit
MVTPNVDDSLALTAQPRTQVAGLAAVWPKPRNGLAISVVEGMHVLSLRHWPGAGTAELAAALATALAAALATLGLPTLPTPGQSSGSEPRLVWRSPNEIWVLTVDGTRAAALLAALPARAGGLACALDLSSGVVVAQLQGSAVETLLAHLVDAQALPLHPGQASHVRLVDIAAMVWREAPDRVGVVVDRAHDHYLAHWLSHALESL